MINGGTLNMRAGGIFSNTAVNGGGIANSSGTFRISDGVIYGTDTVGGRENMADAGVALFNDGIAQYGMFSNGDFVSEGNLTTSNVTVRIVAGESLIAMIIAGPVSPPGFFTAGTVGFLQIPITARHVMGAANQTIDFDGNVTLPSGINIFGDIAINAAGMGEGTLSLMAMTALSEVGNHTVYVNIGGVIGTFTLEVR